MIFDQLAFWFDTRARETRLMGKLALADGEAAVFYRENPRARRYLLSVHRDGTVHVTIPRRGNRTEAELFVRGKMGWVERQRRKVQAKGIMPREWTVGTEVMIAGAWHRIEVRAEGPPFLVEVGPVVFEVARWQENLRPWVEEHLRRLAQEQLTARTLFLAARHGLEPGRVIVRSQSTRWGSCSAKGTISLNWRLVQAPEAVVDYIILHELMHLREMNHSRRFWLWVERVCPGYREAERWLKENAARLGM